MPHFIAMHAAIDRPGAIRLIRVPTRDTGELLTSAPAAGLALLLIEATDEATALQVARQHWQLPEA